MTDTIDSLQRKVRRLSRALRRIRGSSCERVWGQGYACISDKWLSINAEHTADRWCNSCIAHDALRSVKRPRVA